MLIEIKETFVGPFSDILRQFIEYKRALGYKYSREAKWIQAFDRFSLNYKLDQTVLSKDIVYDWVQRKENETYENQKKRIYIIRQLALFFRMFELEAYVYPLENIKHYRSKFMPYIFNKEEITNLMISADNIKNGKFHPYRQDVISMIMRLLYGCGLRVSEALNLNLDDIDLKNGNITITDGKKDNDRLVPTPSVIYSSII